jgi:hypothetical protein
MFSHDDCLAKAAELERLAEAAPGFGRNCHYIAAAWRRLAVQSEWQDKLLAIIDRGHEPCAGREFPNDREPPNPGLITFHHIRTPGRFVFSSPELPGWRCVGRSRECAGRKVIGSWRKYLANHHDLDAGLRAELVAMIPFRSGPTRASPG